MKVIDLATLKALAKVTFTAQDAALTATANGVEASVEKYLKRDLQTLTEAQQSSIEHDLTCAAVLKWQDAGYNIWAGGVLARALFHLRLPGVAVEST